VKAIAALIGVMLLWSTLVAAQGPETFTARLSSLPADARTRPDLAGSGSVSGVLTGSKFVVSGSFEGLISPATVAQIHRGIERGVRGAVVFDLTISKAESGNITGSFDLTPSQVESLKKGQLYVQLSSEKTPDGTLWGWFLR